MISTVFTNIEAMCHVPLLSERQKVPFCPRNLSGPRLLIVEWAFHHQIIRICHVIWRVVAELIKLQHYFCGIFSFCRHASNKTLSSRSMYTCMYVPRLCFQIPSITQTEKDPTFLSYISRWVDARYRHPHSR